MRCRHWITACAITLLLISGCAKIPQESVELSVAVGNQIASLEQAHLALLDSFFAEKERQVEQFIQQQWAPEFNRNFFNDPQISNKWQQVSSSPDPADRTAFLNWVGPIIQQQVSKKRQQLLQPLAATERQLRRQLQQSYLQLYSMNDSITQLLSSAATVQNKRSHYQRLLGIDDNKISAKLGQVDRAVTRLLGTAEQISGEVERTESYLQSLRQLAELISAEGGG